MARPMAAQRLDRRHCEIWCCRPWISGLAWGLSPLYLNVSMVSSTCPLLKHRKSMLSFIGRSLLVCRFDFFTRAASLNGLCIAGMKECRPKLIKGTRLDIKKGTRLSHSLLIIIVRRPCLCSVFLPPQTTKARSQRGAFSKTRASPDVSTLEPPLFSQFLRLISSIVSRA